MPVSLGKIGEIFKPRVYTRDQYIRRCQEGAWAGHLIAKACIGFGVATTILVGAERVAGNLSSDDPLSNIIAVEVGVSGLALFSELCGQAQDRRLQELAPDTPPLTTRQALNL